MPVNNQVSIFFIIIKKKNCTHTHLILILLCYWEIFPKHKDAFLFQNLLH